MKNILESGLQFLSQQQETFCSSPVVYGRDNEAYPVNAVLGKTKYAIADDSGFTVYSHTTDFLIAAAALPFDPKTGDTIFYEGNVYEVIDLGAGCWTWCEPHQFRRRIHTQIFTKQ